jgi:hypothetical protein
MDIRAKNSITDRVQFTGIVIEEEQWEREGNEPEENAPVTYLGPERRTRRETQDMARSRTA